LKARRTILIIIFSSLFLDNYVFGSKDYREYYINIDSAEYYFSIKNYAKSVEIYDRTFSKYDGFPAHYLEAIKASILNDKKAIDLFVIGYKKTRGFRNDLISSLSFLEKKGRILNSEKKRILKLYRKTKPLIKKNRKGGKLIFKLILKDQLGRYSKKYFSDIDSLNNIELKKAVLEDSNFFNHLQYGFIINSMLDILIFHQTYNLWGDYFELLLDNVKQGKVSRETVLYLLQREVVWGNNLFEIKNDSLIFISNKNNFTCDSFSVSFSIFGGFNTYDPKTKRQIIIPLHPNYSTEQIDQLRKYLLCSPYSLFQKTNKHYFYPTKEEYCEIIE
jgi:hypothetical protein